jgi:hypothetical protein
LAQVGNPADRLIKIGSSGYHGVEQSEEQAAHQAELKIAQPRISADRLTHAEAVERRRWPVRRIEISSASLSHTHAGRDDRVAPYERSLLLCAHIPNPRLLLLNRCGH